MCYDWHRILSGTAALLLVGGAVLSGEPAAIITMLSVLIWPMAMIWWPEVVGSMTTRFGFHGLLNQNSAALMVRSFGWVMLAFIVLVVVWYIPWLERQMP